jgi:hypothetical protein
MLPRYTDDDEKFMNGRLHISGAEFFIFTWA